MIVHCAHARCTVRPEHSKLTSNPNCSQVYARGSIPSPFSFWADQWLRASMIFDIRIVLYSARRITIAEESPSLTTAKVESAKNILLKIVDSHPIAKLNSAADFCPSRGDYHPHGDHPE